MGVGEATTKQNTMNVPMCKLQAKERPEDRWLVLVVVVARRVASRRVARALNYPDKRAAGDRPSPVNDAKIVRGSKAASEPRFVRRSR